MLEKQPRSRKSASKPVPTETDYYEKKLQASGFRRIAGVDEAGRGPLAGPVVAAAVILGGFSHPWIRDSKKLTPKRRDAVYTMIMENAVAVNWASVGHRRIDRINIYNASREAMVEAVSGLALEPDHLLVDAMKLDVAIPSESIIKGDSLSDSIAAASIIAKVTRDRMMLEYHGRYPVYGFDAHKGYPTARHRKLLQEYGPCPIHRRSFRPVREAYARTGK